MIAPYIPLESPELGHDIYNMVLYDFLRDDAERFQVSTGGREAWGGQGLTDRQTDRHGQRARVCVCVCMFEREGRDGMA